MAFGTDDALQYDSDERRFSSCAFATSRELKASSLEIHAMRIMYIMLNNMHGPISLDINARYGCQVNKSRFFGAFVDYFFHCFAKVLNQILVLVDNVIRVGFAFGMLIQTVVRRDKYCWNVFVWRFRQP